MTSMLCKRHQDPIRDRISAASQIRGRHRVAAHIGPGDIARPRQTRIAGARSAIVQQRLGRAASRNARMHRTGRDQDGPGQNKSDFVILLRMLHRKTPRNFVTGQPNHSIYNGIKELAKAGRREERPSSGKNSP